MSGLFLILPTLVVAVGAFTTATGQPHARQRHRGCSRTSVSSTRSSRSIELAVGTAIAGAIIGGLLAWAVVRGDPNGLLRQLVIAASGVLAQFGGVMLAFAFLATFGFNGLATMFFRDILHVDLLTDASWLYSLAGPGRRLHLLPDPADADRLPAVARWAPPGVVRRVGEPRWLAVVVLAERRRADPGARPSWVRCCCCSPTRSRPTRPPRPSSARAARSSPSRSRTRCRARSSSARRTSARRWRSG